MNSTLVISQAFIGLFCFFLGGEVLFSLILVCFFCFLFFIFLNYDSGIEQGASSMLGKWSTIELYSQHN